MPKKEKATSSRAPRAVDELLDEVQEIRDLVSRIEKRTIYLRPDNTLKAAGKQIGAGILRGFGILIGGVLFAIIFGFLVQRALRSEQVQSFIGEQFESIVGDAVERQMERFPFN